MLNFLYAFDKNYNQQACVSIYSLLENVDQKINIYIVLDSSNEKFKFPKVILNHVNLNNFIIKNINVKNSFYNIEKAHVSKATFYRLYLDTLFEDSNFDLIYLDSDIVCVKNPISDLQFAISSMKKNNKFIGFTDEFYRFQNEEPLIRLNMKNDKYFNAGVMLVNLEQWKINNLSTKAIALTEKLKHKAKFWDQDILNSLIDGNYFPISKNLNFKTVGVGENRSLNDAIFVHYSGKSKPWDVGGVFEEFAFIYHEFYKQLFNKQYHVVTKNRKNSLNKLIDYRQYYKTLSFKKLFVYVTYSIAAIIRKEN